MFSDDTYRIGVSSPFIVFLAEPTIDGLAHKDPLGLPRLTWPTKDDLACRGSLGLPRFIEPTKVHLASYVAVRSRFG